MVIEDPRALVEKILGIDALCSYKDYDAAVAVIYEIPSRSLVLIERAERPGDPWSGHIAFPGGFRKASDESSYHTALREAWEEVSADLGGAEHLGSAGIWTTGRGVRVVPHLFLSKRILSLGAGGEVARILRAGPGELLEGPCPEGFSRPPCYAHRRGGKVVWGFTARLIAWILADEARAI